MHCYWFEVDVAGPVTEHDIESLGDRLSAADGIDASVQADDPGETVMFSREAEDAVQAVISAVHDVEAAGMRVTGVADDRVTVHEIADRARVSAASVRYWISAPWPGRIPDPAPLRLRSSVYSRAEVAACLAEAKLGETDLTAAETAQACRIIDAAVTVRNGLRELPRHNGPLVRQLVA